VAKLRGAPYGAMARGDGGGPELGETRLIKRLAILYRSSKAAVNMVMRSLAIDLAPRGIICVVINPGWVRTDMGGTNATLDPSESISRMRRVIATLGPELSGKFFNHTGREYPW
jgi:NAD(P)-dependent dehydrogenase (short-subunit alcohol dehydrogenase family)